MKEKDFRDFFATRKLAWKESFHSLFGLYQTNWCPYFYLLYPLFNVLFLSSGIGGYSTRTAIMSRSTKGLRSKLKAESMLYRSTDQVEVTFLMPLEEGEVDEMVKERQAKYQAEINEFKQFKLISVHSYLLLHSIPYCTYSFISFLTI